MGRGHSWVVGLAWVGMTALSLWYIGRFGSRVPWVDDFWYIDAQLAPGLPDGSYLWDQVNEHRLPLPKLLNWAVAKTFGFSLRAEMRVDLLVLSALAAGLILAARRLRGRTHAADAFFPLLLLTPGQWENLLLGVQVNFVLPAALQGAALALVAGTGARLGWRRAAAAGTVAVLLPLNGAQGLVPGAALAVWLLVAGRAGERRTAAVAVAGGLAALAVTAAYFVGYQPPAAAAGVVRTGGLEARYVVRLLGGAWGPVAEVVGPAEPTPWPTLFGGLTAVFLAITGWRVVTATRRPGDRVAAGGLGLLAAGLLALAAATAWGRAALSAGVLASRYHLLAMPLLCGAYLAWLRLAPAAAPAVTAGLFVVAVAAAGPNLQHALACGREHHLNHTLIERDILCGVPAPFLAEHHDWCLLPPRFDGLTARSLEILKRAGRPPFAGMAAAPAVAEVPVGWRAVPALGRTAADGFVTPDVLGTVVLDVSLDRPDLVGIAVTYSLRGDPAAVDSEAHWVGPLADGRPGPRALRKVFEPGDGRRKQVWLGAGATGLRVVVRGPAAVRVEGVAGIVVVGPGR